MSNGERIQSKKKASRRQAELDLLREAREDLNKVANEIQSQDAEEIVEESRKVYLNYVVIREGNVEWTFDKVEDRGNGVYYGYGFHPDGSGEEREFHGEVI